jgi:outer membrane protein TolC
MNRSLFRFAAHLQLALAIVLASGCTPTQPFFLNEKPDLQHYLNAATSIEYPDVEVESLPEATQSRPPLSISNHTYDEFWDLSLEEAVSIALQNARFIPTTGGTAEVRQNIAAQFVSGTADQFGSVYDIALQQSTTQSIPLTTDGNGNRLLPRGAVRANQIGGVEDALAEFDAVASGFLDLSTTDRPQNVSSADLNPDDDDSPQFLNNQNTTQQAALSKRLATGGVATLRQQILYTRNDSGNIVQRAVNSDYTAVIEAQVQHPLMRNRGTYINRIPVVLASLNEDISIAQFESQIRNLVRDVENAYWDLYIAYRAVAAARIGRDSAMATAQFAKLNLDAGTGTIQELSQAVGQYWTFEAALKQALAPTNLPGEERFGVYGRERALRELLGLTATDTRLIRPIDEPTLARVDFDWSGSVAQMLYLSPELRRSKIEIKQSELELALAKNQILPEVNLSFLYRWVGLGNSLGPSARTGERFPSPQSSALAELTSGGFQELGVRLELSQPVGVRREMTRIRNATIRLKQRQEYLREQERFAVFQLSDALAKVKSHFALVQDNANRWQAAEQEVDARLLQYQKGLSPVNVVLQSQQRKAEAQIAYYRALAEYNKSLNYVDYLRGTLLANSNITLREGPWNSKAYCDALERARERAAGYELQYGVTRPEVVRRGPVKNAEGAVQVMGISDDSAGEIIHDPMGMNLHAPREIEPIDDQPLEAIESPQQLMPRGNAPQLPTPNPSTSPTPVVPPTSGPGDATPKSSSSQPRSNQPHSILVPSADDQSAASTPQSIQPVNYQRPAAVSRSKQIGGQPAVKSGPPMPVQRRPISTAD